MEFTCLVTLVNATHIKMVSNLVTLTKVIKVNKDTVKGSYTQAMWASNFAKRCDFNRKFTIS
jgi:hypothetical protein